MSVIIPVSSIKEHHVKEVTHVKTMQLIMTKAKVEHFGEESFFLCLFLVFIRHYLPLVVGTASSYVPVNMFKRHRSGDVKNINIDP